MGDERAQKNVKISEKRMRKEKKVDGNFLYEKFLRIFFSCSSVLFILLIASLKNYYQSYRL